MPRSMPIIPALDSTRKSKEEKIANALIGDDSEQEWGYLHPHTIFRLFPGLIPDKLKERVLQVFTPEQLRMRAKTTSPIMQQAILAPREIGKTPLPTFVTNVTPPRLRIQDGSRDIDIQRDYTLQELFIANVRRYSPPPIWSYRFCGAVLGHDIEGIRKLLGYKYPHSTVNLYKAAESGCKPFISCQRQRLPAERIIPLIRMDIPTVEDFRPLAEAIPKPNIGTTFYMANIVQIPSLRLKVDDWVQDLVDLLQGLPDAIFQDAERFRHLLIAIGYVGGIYCPISSQRLFQLCCTKKAAASILSSHKGDEVRQKLIQYLAGFAQRHKGKRGKVRAPNTQGRTARTGWSFGSVPRDSLLLSLYGFMDINFSPRSSEPSMN